jgi:hypothetical protein
VVVRSGNVHTSRILIGLGVLVACGGGGGDQTTTVPDAPPAAPPTHDVTVAVDGTGTVTSDPPGIACPGTCKASFAPGTHVKLVVAAAEGWRFEKWNAPCSGDAKNTTCEVVVDAQIDAHGALSQIDPRWDPAVGAMDCASAWGTAGEKLSPCDQQKDHYVVVHKSKRNVALCSSGALVKNFRSGLGFAPAGSKEKQGDGKTPEGVFYAADLLPNSDYYKAFLFSYPTKADAARGLAAGIITAQDKDAIDKAQDTCAVPPQDTGLGGAVEIHGDGSSKDWTVGCVALDNEGIDALWGVIAKGDTLVVLP